MTRATKPTTVEERAYWRATSKLHTTTRRLIDDIAERDADRRQEGMHEQ